MGETCVTRIALRAAELHLDELVVVQRTDRFRDDRLADARGSDP